MILAYLRTEECDKLNWATATEVYESKEFGSPLGPVMSAKLDMEITVRKKPDAPKL